MHWFFLILVALAITFIALGALSVWVAALSLALKLAMACLAAFATYTALNLIIRRKS
ncbi:hypothetical protein [Ferriphaselus sp. R-1]|uniref:hypothetical protein n=1 Tax=Ferriphaselus sp. R-1 TaxID=1485544 RepID=UPI0013767484|nr:hypothetical protein [Ferriphaselus sp. R-1]